MSETNKNALICLRLAAECRDLAAGVAVAELRGRFVRMAEMWEELAQRRCVESPAD